MGRVFSPLDKQLELSRSDLTPQVLEGVVRLASWVPYERACQLLQALLGVQVSKACAHRQTVRAGQGLLADWEEQAEGLLRQPPEVTPHARKQVLSADGAMVPLQGGVWGEVKTLAVGVVEQNQPAEVTVCALSSCSRLGEVAEFEKASVVETHRREVEGAAEVAAVLDGAVWLQATMDYHRHDAVRILDFAHAAEYVSAIGDAVRRTGHHLPKDWLTGVLHRLKHEGPTRVLRHLAHLTQRCADEEGEKKWRYLSQRESQMQYPTYHAAGWPIGSGMVESANKLVVEARLKGAGMHWKRENVNPMLLLRNAVCNDRWSESWHRRIAHEQRGLQQARTARTQHRLEHALAQVLQLCFTLGLPRRARPAPAPVASLPASPPRPKGRTQAQHRWGRRPLSPRGARIYVGFAKQ